MASRASQFPQGVPVVSVAYLFHICEGSWMCSICPCPLTTGKTPAALKPHQLGPRLCPDLPGARPTSGGFRNRRRPSPPMEEQQPPPPPRGPLKQSWGGSALLDQAETRPASPHAGLEEMSCSPTVPPVRLWPRPHQTIYLAGMVAGQETRTGRVGACMPVVDYETFPGLSAWRPNSPLDGFVTLVVAPPPSDPSVVAHRPARYFLVII